MKIVINGEDTQIDEKSTIADLIERFEIAKTAAACALNTRVVARSDWAAAELKEGDRIEILRFVGGG